MEYADSNAVPRLLAVNLGRLKNGLYLFAGVWYNHQFVLG